MGILETWVEIPIKVTYDAYPAEGDGWESPKLPAGLDVECVEVPKDIEEYILKEFADQLYQECIDAEDPDPGDPDEREPHSRSLFKACGITGGKA